MDIASQIDIRRMRTVLEVARAEAITAAAQTLGLTQSAVSRTVAEVEDALGQRLFDRLPRGIQLTDAGQRFVARARGVLAEFDDLVAEMNAPTTQLTGRLRLGIAATGAHATGAIARARSHPAVALETLHASEQTLCLAPRARRTRSRDRILAYLRRWRELEITPSPACTSPAWCGRRTLAALAAPREADVLAYPLILPESVELTYTSIAQRYAHHGLPLLKPHYVTNNLELVKLLVHTTDAFFPLLFPDEAFGGLGQEFLLLRDVLELPAQYLACARATQRPRRRVAKCSRKPWARCSVRLVRDRRARLTPERPSRGRRDVATWRRGRRQGANLG